MTQKEVNIIEDIINKELILGSKSKTICENVAKQFNISTRQAGRYLSRVKSEMVEHHKQQREYYRAEAIHVKKDLFKQAYTEGDYKNANVIHDSECKLKDLFNEPTQQQNQQPLNIQINIAPTNEKVVISEVIKKDDTNVT